MDFSIIIATRNRSRQLKACLESLWAQNTTGKFSWEILVVDNHSTDDTKDMIKSLASQTPVPLRYGFEPDPGKCKALNLGIEQAVGRHLIFTDDDIIADKFWLQNIADCFTRFACDGVGGRVLPQYPEETPSWVKANADILSGPIVMYDYGQDHKPYEKPMFEFLGSNFAFKKELFKEYGLFSETIGPGTGSFGDDTEIVNRFFKAGKKLYYCGRAVVWHPVEKNRMSLSYIGAWNSGLGKYRFMVDEHNHANPAWVYWLGVPRYMFPVFLRNIKRLLAHLFNRREFLMAWIELNRNWGKAMQIRKVYRDQHA